MMSDKEFADLGEGAILATCNFSEQPIAWCRGNSQGAYGRCSHDSTKAVNARKRIISRLHSSSDPRFVRNATNAFFAPTPRPPACGTMGKRGPCEFR